MLIATFINSTLCAMMLYGAFMSCLMRTENMRSSFIFKFIPCILMIMAAVALMMHTGVFVLA